MALSYPVRINRINLQQKIIKSWIFLGGTTSGIQKELSKLEQGKDDSYPLCKQKYGAKWVNELIKEINQAKTQAKTQAKAQAKIQSKSTKPTKGKAEPSDLKAALAETTLDMPESDMVTELPFTQEEFSLDDILKLDVKQEVLSKAPIKVDQPIEFITQVELYPEDNVMDFKQKLYVCTKIPIYRQHIWVTYLGRTLPLSYNLLVENKTKRIDLLKALQNTNQSNNIEGIPIDTNMFNLRNEYRIESTDEFVLLEQYEKKYGVREFTLADMSDFMIPIVDRHQMELFYYGFVMLYWPMMTLPVWLQWTKDPKEFAALYPDLAPSRSELAKKFEMENKIMNLKGEPQVPFDMALMRTVILVLNPSSHPNFVQQRNLFDHMALDETIDACRCLVLKDQLQGLGLGTETIVQLDKVYKNAELILDNLPINTCMFRLNTPEHNFTVLIQSDGHYRIFAHWRENENMTFEKVLKVVQTGIEPFIQKINAIGTLALDGPLPLIENYKFAEIDMQYVYRSALTESEFDYLIGVADRYVQAGIMQRNTVQPSTKLTWAEYFFHKGMFEYDIRRLQRTLRVQNTYDYLTEGIIKSRWDGVFTRTRRTSIGHQFADIKVDIKGVREMEFVTFDRLLRVLFFMFEQERKHIKQKQTKRVQNVKILRSFDPALYDTYKFMKNIQRQKKKSLELAGTILTSYGNPNLPSAKKGMYLYSKICQKPYQPVVLNKFEIDKMSKEEQDRVVKFWNYTTNTPAYYFCPHRKTPYVSFLVKKHPFDYCIPCCKQRRMEVWGHTIPDTYQKGVTQAIEGDTKAQIFNECLQTHLYSKERAVYTATRYVITYGRDVNPERVSSLPQSSLGAFFSESGSKTEPDCKQPGGLFLYGVPQNFSNLSNSGFIFALANVLEVGPDELIRLAQSHVNVRTFTQLLRGHIYNYFDHPTSLIEEMAKIPSGEPKNAPWQDIFMDIALLMKINTVYFRDQGEITLSIPPGVSADTYFHADCTNMIVIERKGIVHPIYVINLNAYFARKEIEQKLFANDSPIMIMVQELLRQTMQPRSQSNMFDLNNLLRFRETTLERRSDLIDLAYMNKQGMCYGASVDGFYLPLIASMASVTNSTTDPPMPSSLGNYKLVHQFIAQYNKWVETTNKASRLAKSKEPVDTEGPSELEHLEESAIIQVNGRSIGFVANGLQFYCHGAPIPAQTKKPIVTMFYNPFELNKLISQPYNPPKPNAKQLRYSEEAAYEASLYHMLLLEFKTVFDQQRNRSMRSKIKNALGQLFKNRIDFEQLFNQLPKMSNYDIYTLMSIIQIEGDYNAKNIRTIMDQIDKKIFNFDRMLLNELINMKDHNKLRMRLERIAKTIISDGSKKVENKKANANLDQVDNTFTSCHSRPRQKHCLGSKLVIKKQHMKELLDALTTDMLNPLKGPILFSDIIQNVAFYKFISRPHESIFINAQ